MQNSIRPSCCLYGLEEQDSQDKSNCQRNYAPNKDTNPESPNFKFEIDPLLHCISFPSSRHVSSFFIRKAYNVTFNAKGGIKCFQHIYFSTNYLKNQAFYGII